MKQAFLFISLGVILCGCNTTHIIKPNLESRYLSDEELPKLTATKPLALKNASLNTVEMQLCSYDRYYLVFGKLFDFTNSALGTVKNALERKSVVIDEKADKILELSVYEADCMPETWTFKTVIGLRIRTGDGVEMVCKGDAHIFNAFATAVGFEQAINDSVRQMLNDKYIINYIEK
jgi:hypothetical protein